MLRPVWSPFYRRAAPVGLTLALLVPGVAFGETSLAECSDAIDNDSNGLIDLDDPGCNYAPRSMILNPSFENYSVCPASNSSLTGYVDDWVEATESSPDYFNTCGYTGVDWVGTPPPPDGNGWVGTIALGENWTPSFIEYVGTCTITPLLSGTSYTLSLSAGATEGGVDVSPMDPIELGVHGDLVVIGVPDCTSFPIGGVEQMEDTHTVLDRVTVDIAPKTYERVVFEFTPTADYTGFMIGPARDMGPSPGYVYQYVLWDQLVLNETDAFGPEIAVSGDCGAGYTLSVPAGRGNVQWYRDGIAIAGATGDSYAVPVSGAGSEYLVRVDDGTKGYLAPSAFTMPVCPGSDGFLRGGKGLCSSVSAPGGLSAILLALGVVGLRRRRS